MATEQLPQWFIDLFLDFKTELKTRKEEFHKTDTGLIRDETAGGIKTKAYAIFSDISKEMAFVAIREDTLDENSKTEYCHLVTKLRGQDGGDDNEGSSGA